MIEENSMLNSSDVIKRYKRLLVVMSAISVIFFVLAIVSYEDITNSGRIISLSSIYYIPATIALIAALLVGSTIYRFKNTNKKQSIVVYNTFNIIVQSINITLELEIIRSTYLAIKNAAEHSSFNMFTERLTDLGWGGIPVLLSLSITMAIILFTKTSPTLKLLYIILATVAMSYQLNPYVVMALAVLVSLFSTKLAKLKYINNQ